MKDDTRVSVLLQSLAELIRPHTIDQYIGQHHLFGSQNDGRVSSFIRLGYLPSLVFYGPPGVGKTTIAKVVAKEARYVFLELSATNTTVSQLKELRMAITGENKKRHKLGKPLLNVVVFVDEIHRFSKTQQDLLLPYIEAGDFAFVGATTNVSRLAPAILSRCQCIELEQLSISDLRQIITRAVLYENVRRRIADKPGVLKLTNEALDEIAAHGNGDARKCINLIELLSSFYDGKNLQGESNVLDVNANDVAVLLKKLSQSQKDGISQDKAILYDNLSDCLLNRPPRHKLKEDINFDNRRTKQLNPNQLAFEIKFLDDDPPEETHNIQLSESTIYDTFKHSDSTGNNPSDIFSAQMQVSDDSDLESSDEPYNNQVKHNCDTNRITLDHLKSGEYFLLMANFYVQKLLQQNEPVLSIIRFLILFDSKFVNVQDSRLVNLMSAEHLLHKADVENNLLLANAVELLVKAPKSNLDWEEDPRLHIPGLTSYWSHFLRDKTDGSSSLLSEQFEIKTSPAWATKLDENIRELEFILKKREEEYSLDFDIKDDPRHIFDDDEEEEEYIKRSLSAR